jgi:aryl-alcohol dehydrogenase-like predicted oxidoreductase
LTEIELGNTGLRSPAIGFGCAALLGRTGKADSLRALAAAWDEGIRFFDTARSYGYGESEGLLGSFLKGRRDRALIATKFGILPSRQTAWKKVAKSVARSVLAVAPSSRRLLQKGAATQFSSNQFTVPVLQQSIDESLQKLGTDYVDILYMHSAPAGVLDQNDLLEALTRLVKAGKVRVAGISAAPDVIESALERGTAPLRAMQFPCNVFDLSAAFALGAKNSAGSILTANHPFGGAARVQACRTILRDLANLPAIDPTLREKLREVDDHLLAEVVFSTILSGTGIHMVIPAMMQVHHVRTNVSAATRWRFTPEEVNTIRTALRSPGVPA